jgi:two-component system phosphate regulon response regulator PhoB
LQISPNQVLKRSWPILHSSPKVLVATNDADVSLISHLALDKIHFGSVSAHDENEMLMSVHVERPDMVILDMALPDAGGIELCRELRSDVTTSDIPIIMITDESNESDMIRALESGADDCVSKPLNVDELAARIKAIRRRAGGRAAKNPRLIAGPIEMDLDRWTVRVEGQSVFLTKMEFRLLLTLLEAKGRALTRDFLLETTWSHSAAHRIETRTVDVHVGRLRRKLGPAGRHIITIRNVGFRFDAQPEWFTSGSNH